MKKFIISLLLSSLLIMVMNVGVAAQSQKSSYSDTQIDNLVSSYIADMGIYNQNNSYTIGNEIPIYNVATDNSLVLRNSTKIYPVYENDTVILTIAVDGESFKISPMGVDGINLAIGDEYNTFVFLANDVNAFLVTNKDVFLADTIKSDVDKPLASISIANARSIVDTMPNNFSRRAICFTSFNENSRGGITLPTRGQSPYSLGCWAACMASFVSHYNGSNTYVSNVIYEITGSYNQVSARTITQVINYLNLHYDIMAYSKSVSSSSFCSTARTNLDAGKAYILGWSGTYYDSVTGTSTSVNHMTCLMRWIYQSSTYKYTIMDPIQSNMGGGTYILGTSSSTSFPPNLHIVDNVSCSLSASLVYGYNAED